MNPAGTDKLPAGLRVPPGHAVYAYRDGTGHLKLVSAGIVLVDLTELIEQVNRTARIGGAEPAATSRGST